MSSSEQPAQAPERLQLWKQSPQHIWTEWLDHFPTKPPHFEFVRADLAAPRAVSLEEIETILAPMMRYAKIHYIRGVRYPEGTHEEITDKYEKVLNRLRNA